MGIRPRFTLAAILGCTAVLCVPIAMIAARNEFGVMAMFPVIGGCVGYLLNGGDGTITGGFIGILAWFLLVVATMPR